ncbi:MAG: RidA family protein [Rhodovarius sp.]|nr:RidA family protein [Rhodovarius sp.]
MLTPILPEGWPTPRGYSHAMLGQGRILTIAGQIGTAPDGTLARGFVAQAELALRNILALVKAAGGEAQHIARLGWYVTDMEAYRESLAELGPAYRAVMGRHYPAMVLVQVAALVEPEALVEVEATAILP